MKVIVLDFETYYDKDYSLSKMSTEEYVRHPLFEVIGVSVKVDDGPTTWFSGTMRETAQWLKQFDWGNAGVVAHNAIFDGAILSWHFGIKPRAIFDTMSMARGLLGPAASCSLASLVQRYGLGVKGDEVIRALGMRRSVFSQEELERYGEYCRNDVELTHKLFHRLLMEFPRSELRVVDLIMRMFTEPVLGLNRMKLVTHLAQVQQDKQELLDKISADASDLQSNNKFAELLQQLGVDPPTKLSARTGKDTWAFAKTDVEFLALQEHENPDVQALVAARLGTKGTGEESRVEMLLGIEDRGLIPMQLKYCAAHTGRMGGDGGINPQNFASRGKYKNKIKACIEAPSNMVLLDADSSQIEARVLAWLSGQDDLVDAFQNKQDVYKQMASRIYAVPVSEVDDAQRFLGKTTILGAGYGLGASRFIQQLKVQAGLTLAARDAEHTIRTYRETYPRIPDLWYQCDRVLMSMVQGDRTQVDPYGVVQMVGESELLLPSGRCLRYTGLRAEEESRGVQFYHTPKKNEIKIWGGVMVENIVQALARDIVMAQMVRIAKRYRVVLTVHDSVVCVAPAGEVDDAAAYMLSCMQWAPPWAAGLPVTGEVKVGPTYGELKKWAK